MAMEEISRTGMKIHDRTVTNMRKVLEREEIYVINRRAFKPPKNRNSSMNIEEFLLTLKTTNMKILTTITSVKTLFWLPRVRNLFLISQGEFEYLFHVLYKVKFNTLNKVTIDLVYILLILPTENDFL